MEWWDIPRRGWIIILAELAAIITLAGWVYSEYVNNTYFQSYVNSSRQSFSPFQCRLRHSLSNHCYPSLLHDEERTTYRRSERGSSPEKARSSKEGSKKATDSAFENRENHDSRTSDGAKSTSPNGRSIRPQERNKLS